MSRVLPILFNTDMVRAILDGRKTVTRRVIKPQPKLKLCYTFAGSDCGTWGYPSKTAHEFWGEEFKLPEDITEEELKKKWNPPYQPVDILYVRETWCSYHMPDGSTIYEYRASDPNGNRRPTGPEYDDPCEIRKWRPSIHMPKEAARIWLKVKDVRVERLQEITEEQAEKEGFQSGSYEFKGAVWGQEDTEEWTAVEEFGNLWNSTIKGSDLERYGWDANPWVWVIEFERCEKPETI